MEDEERIRRLPEGLPRIGIFKLWPHLHGLYREPLNKDFAALIPFFASRGNYDERMLTSYLGLFISGQMPLRFLVDQIGKMDDDNIDLSHMTESLKLLLVAGLFLAVGFLLGTGNHRPADSRVIADKTLVSLNGAYALNATGSSVILTDTRSGQVWLLGTQKSGQTSSPFWEALPAPK